MLDSRSLSPPGGSLGRKAEVVPPDGGAPWREAGTWSGEGIHREAWFFSSGNDRLYASLYAAAERRLDVGLVVCPSWGWELAHQLDLCHDLARSLARFGGAGLIYHPPGHGDSTGESESVTMERLVDAAVDAVAEAAGRRPGFAWRFAGIRLGGAVAIVAGERLGHDFVVLIQPALNAPEYFREALRTGRRASLGAAASDGAVFGHSVGEAILSSASGLDVAGALRRFGGRGLVVRCEPSSPSESPSLAGLDIVTLSRPWRLHPRPRDRTELVGSA